MCNVCMYLYSVITTHVVIYLLPPPSPSLPLSSCLPPSFPSSFPSPSPLPPSLPPSLPSFLPPSPPHQVDYTLPVGTPEYISPEVLTSLDKKLTYGVSCDWWSVGIILYELLFERTPFEGKSIPETYANIMSFEVRGVHVHVYM